MTRRAMGLVEILIGVVCLSIVAAAIILATITGRQASYRSENRAVARYLALEAVELVRGLPFAELQAAARASGTRPKLGGILPITDERPEPRRDWNLSLEPIGGAVQPMTYGDLFREEAFPDFYRTVSLKEVPGLGSSARPVPAVRADVLVFWWELGQEGRGAAQRELAVSTVVTAREAAP